MPIRVQKNESCKNNALKYNIMTFSDRSVAKLYYIRLKLNDMVYSIGKDMQYDLVRCINIIAFEALGVEVKEISEWRMV